MRPGTYRDLITIEREVSADGEPVPDYSGGDLYTSVPCDIVTTGGDETYRGRQLEAHLSHVITMQYLPNITPRMRVTITGGTLAGRTIHIAYVRPIDVQNGMSRKLELYCRENVDG